MNRDEHALLGAATGILVDVWITQRRSAPPSAGRLVLSAIGGSFAGILPDYLEPAYDPNHRRFFHSITFQILCVAGVAGAWSRASRSDEPRIILTSLVYAYLSHLLADALTPKGLPRI